MSDRPTRPRLADRAAVAERALLAALLHNPGDVGEGASVLTADDFSQHAYRQVWESLVALWRRGQPVELASVGEELLARRAVEDLGGWPALAALYEEGSPGQQAAHYAGRVAALATLRRLAALGQEVTRLAEEPDADAAEALGQAEARLFALARPRAGSALRRIDGLLAEEADRLDRLTALPPGERGVRGVPSGLAGLDALTGGWQPGALAVVAARPSVGKTALAVLLARSAARAGLGVLVCSLEQSAAELTRRLLAALAEVDGTLLDRADLGPGECARVLAAARHAAGWRLHIDDAPRASLLQLAAAGRRLRARGELDLLLVDYLQLVEPEDRRAPRHEQVAGVSRRLKALARELGVPLVALAQLNRASEDRPDNRPRLSDLRESGGIEADADVVLLLHRPVGREHLLELHLAKNRNGPTGELTVEFDRARMTFAECGVF